jgi:geranylgeranyl diphosphate synthase, type II
MNLIFQLQNEYKAYAAAQHFGSHQPQELYAPIDYILSLGGKSMRPTLLLLAYKAMQGSEIEKALPAAYAVELFHNFSLMHDDIMDASPIRRGQPTVHKKYNTNTAILSGDAMLVYAYQYLAQSPADKIADILPIFNQTAIGVCEGQQYDMNFETTWATDIEQYINMIRLKTAVLLQGALQIGAILAGASLEKAEILGEFGANMGIAFQLQDDYLDTFGEAAKVGKRIGGDILQAKKTFLVLKSLQLATPTQAQELRDLLHADTLTTQAEQQKIDDVTAIFRQFEIPQHLAALIRQYHQKALDLLAQLQLSPQQQQPLNDFIAAVMQRDF